ncbi:MAG: NosD domain-containing protein, partial [Candidatus Kariarchaeaceae archaeon]
QSGSIYIFEILPNTQEGDTVEVSDSESGTTITFTKITSSGETAITVTDTGPSPPTGFKLVPSDTYYDITTTATYEGIITICINYDDSGLTAGQEDNLELRQYNEETGGWEIITTSLDTVNNIICGETTHLSFFGVMFLDDVFLQARDPIIIGNNDQFSAQALSEGWLGDGTKDNPYIIEGYSISSDIQSLIQISNTEVYFIIRNNLLDGMNSGAPFYPRGIYLGNVLNGNISFNTIKNSYTAIHLSSSNNSVIQDNQIIQGSTGVGLYSGSTQNEVFDNRISDVTFGIDIRSSDNTIFQNWINGTTYGIYSSGKVPSNVSFNKIQHSWFGIMLSSALDLIVQNNFIRYNDYGLALYSGSNRNKVFDNWIHNNTNFGIDMRSGSRENQITNNHVFYNNLDGMYLFQSHENAIVGNYIFKNTGSGIYIVNADNNTLKSNEIYENSGHGVFLRFLVDFTEISYNIINNNLGVGVRILYSANNNTVTKNTISANSYGISFGYLTTWNNIVEYNNFINNNQNGDSQGEDDSRSPPFTNIIRYNYWSDWSIPDTDNNGIVDIPYDLNGYVNNQDPYPLTDTVDPYHNTLVGTNQKVLMQVLHPTLRANPEASFASVIKSGNTGIEYGDSNPGPQLVGYVFLNPFFDVTTTAKYKDEIKVCVSYDDSEIPAGFDESYLKILHLLDAEWKDVTWELDKENNRICGKVSSLSWFSLAFIEVPPEAQAGGPYQGVEGIPVLLDASGSTDVDGTITTYEWDIDNNGVFDLSFTSPTIEYTWSDDYSGLITLRVTDDDGLTSTTTAQVDISNNIPEIVTITGPVDPVEISSLIEVSAIFSDTGTIDTHSALWEWGDGTSSVGVIINDLITGSHSYDIPGVYALSLTLTDDDEGQTEALFQYIVIYDPYGSFVTGGGWFTSPEGAYTADPTLTGKATFGFVSKYKKGTTEPTGKTTFVLHFADFQFHSDSYDWLVVAGNKAQFKSTGTLNGQGTYGFMVTALDGKLNGDTTDKFRIKIWDKDTDVIIYDNQFSAEESSDSATIIDGGSITIHDSNRNNKLRHVPDVDIPIISMSSMVILFTLIVLSWQVLIKRKKY